MSATSLHCLDKRVSDTPAGQYCLAHYMELESCYECGAAADQYVRSRAICAGCQDKDIEIVLVSSSLSKHEEASGHDTISQGQGNLNKGFAAKLEKAGFKGVSCWSRSKQLDK